MGAGGGGMEGSISWDDMKKHVDSSGSDGPAVA